MTLSLTRLFILTLFLGCTTIAAAARQSTQTAAAAAATISGRVTVEGKAAPGVEVLLLARNNRSSVALARALTDTEGRFRLTGVSAGSYQVVPVAPTLVAPPQTASGRGGRWLDISAGQNVEGVDFALTRGGVITGQVTDAEGLPVIAERVTLTPVEGAAAERAALLSSNLSFETDDRGIYRIYGVPPGRYLVSAGQSGSAPPSGLRGRKFYQRTFHPDATEELRAVAVEVSAGAEVTNININLARPARTFAVTGRITDSVSGQPVAGVRLSYGLLRDSRQLINAPASNLRSGADGEFKLNGLAPGRYVVYVPASGESDAYSEPLQFEVDNGDVSGLDLKVQRGARLSGVVVVEGATDTTILQRLAHVPVSAFLYQPEAISPATVPSRVNADGSFLLSGLRPGRLVVGSAARLPTGFTLLRVERDGVVQQDGIRINSDEQIAGVRVVLAYGNYVVRGQMRLAGGTPPPGTRFFIYVRREGPTILPRYPAAEVGADGRFVVEGLAAGDYEFVLVARSPAVAGANVSAKPPSTKMLVRVGGASEPEVALVLNLNESKTETEK
ncbi:MAG TPA: carboxypeptidase regulatory-like domain-containing protein [Pyrinomonadaceae bacterium]|nr:carboxypeptidase regulatory-like domain-containing protein [Pyrinomonadaceae bacterium]